MLRWLSEASTELLFDLDSLCGALGLTCAANDAGVSVYRNSLRLIVELRLFLYLIHRDRTDTDTCAITVALRVINSHFWHYHTPSLLGPFGMCHFLYSFSEGLESSAERFCFYSTSTN